MLDGTRGGAIAPPAVRSIPGWTSSDSGDGSRSGGATGGCRAHEFPVDPEVVCQLRMEGERRHSALANADRLTAPFGDDLAAACGLDQRRTDEDARNRAVQTCDADRRLEAVHLPAVAVAAHRDIEETEAALVRAAVDDPPGQQD